jgi:hypothetical protein
VARARAQAAIAAANQAGTPTISQVLDGPRDAGGGSLAAGLHCGGPGERPIRAIARSEPRGGAAMRGAAHAVAGQRPGRGDARRAQGLRLAADLSDLPGSDLRARAGARAGVAPAHLVQRRGVGRSGLTGPRSTSAWTPLRFWPTGTPSSPPRPYLAYLDRTRCGTRWTGFRSTGTAIRAVQTRRFCCITYLLEDRLGQLCANCPHLYVEDRATLSRIRHGRPAGAAGTAEERQIMNQGMQLPGVRRILQAREP